MGGFGVLVAGFENHQSASSPVQALLRTAMSRLFRAVLVLSVARSVRGSRRDDVVFSLNDLGAFVCSGFWPLTTAVSVCLSR